MKILNLGNRVVNQYLVELNDGFLLIDTGYSNGYKRFIKNLSKHRIQKEQIKYVFITHAHDDHIGFLAELLNNFPHITLITNLLSKNRFSEGHNRFVGGCTTLRAYLFCKFMRLMGKGEHTFPIVNLQSHKTIDCENIDNLRTYGINAEIVFLQGHTDDQMGLLFDDGTLFCGDAAMNGFPSKHKIIIFVWRIFICMISCHPIASSSVLKTYLHSNVSYAPASPQSRLLFPMPMFPKISYMS